LLEKWEEADRGRGRMLDGKEHRWKGRFTRSGEKSMNRKRYFGGFLGWGNKKLQVYMSLKGDLHREIEKETKRSWALKER